MHDTTGANPLPAGEFLALVGEYADPTIQFWSTRTGKLERSWQSGHRGIYGLAFSPDGVSVVREQLKPVKNADVSKLVIDLDSDKFVTREAAMRQLEFLGS